MKRPRLLFGPLRTLVVTATVFIPDAYAASDSIEPVLATTTSKDSFACGRDRRKTCAVNETSVVVLSPFCASVRFRYTVLR